MKSNVTKRLSERLFHNVCFYSWSCFHGDKTAFFAAMGNLYQHTHTCANIQREKCFCINFLPISCYDKLVNTIHQNEWDDDELISEAFLTMECTLREIQDLSGAGITAMVIGQVQRTSVEEAYAQGYELRYGRDGFMLPGAARPCYRRAESVGDCHRVYCEIRLDLSKAEVISDKKIY